MNPAFSGWRSYTLVEPPILLFFFGNSAAGPVIHDLMLYRSCQAILGADNYDCEELHTNHTTQELQHNIQPYASYILMYRSFLSALMPAFLAIFLGSWSDRYGRKPLLLAAYAGYATSFLIWSILSSVDNLNPWLFLIPSIPHASVGGYYGLTLATYCYIADIIPENDRAWHLTWLQAAIPVGQLLGSFGGPMIFNKFGYVAVFGAALAANTVATLYILFFVPESLARKNRKGSCCSLFDLSLIKDMFVIVTRKRDGYDRVIIWCCICALAFNTVSEAELNIGYLFAKARVGWGVDEYSLYSAVVVLLTIIGTLLGGRIFKILIDKTMADMLIAILAQLSAFGGSMTKAFTTQSWHFYLSTVLGMLGELSGPIVRNALSKSVSPQEVGKVFSLTTSAGAVMTLAFVPLVAMVYAHNLPPIYPSPAFVVSAGLHAFIIIILVTVDWRISNLSKPTIPPVTVIDEEVD